MITGPIYHQSTNGKWEPIEEPDANFLAEQILDELERHPAQWRRNRISAKAIEACANVIQDLQVVERLIFLAIDFAGLIEEDSIEGDNIDLINRPSFNHQCTIYRCLDDPN